MNKLTELNNLKHLSPSDFDAELAKRLKAIEPKPKKRAKKTK